METDGVADDYFEGKGCKCFARSESECGCDVDWTPKEVYRFIDPHQPRGEAELAGCDGSQIY